MAVSLVIFIKKGAILTAYKLILHLLYNILRSQHH